MRSKDFIFDLAPTMDAIAVAGTDYYLEDIDFPYGNKEEFWNYMVRKYMERKILPRYLDKELDADGEYSVSQTAIRLDMKRLFAANRYKYSHLYSSMTEYDMFSPYHIEEEHLTGTKIAKSTNHKDKVKTENSETSMDVLTYSPTVKTETDGFDITSESDNNKSDSHEVMGRTLTDNASTTHSLDSRTGNIGNHIYADIIKKEREVAMFNLWDIISLDIADMLSFRII